MDAIVTGVFALIGVVIGGITSLLIALFTSKKAYHEKILEKKQFLCLEILINVNDMIDKLPKNIDELQSFKDYLRLEFHPRHDTKTASEEMLYLSDDIRATYLTICIFAENDYSTYCNFNAINQKIIIYRNILVETMREYLVLPDENNKSKQIKQNKRFNDRIQQEIKEIENSIDE